MINRLRKLLTIPVGYGQSIGFGVKQGTVEANDRIMGNFLEAEGNRGLGLQGWEVKTAAYTVIPRDDGKTLGLSHTTGFALTLPAASAVNKDMKIRVVVVTAATSGNHSIAPATGDTIFGPGAPGVVSTSMALTNYAKGDTIELQSAGASGGWYVVSNSAASVNAASNELKTQELTFTETSGAGVWTGTVVVPPGATIHDVIVHATALWDSQTSATLKAGITGDDDGYYTAVDLKATDLLAGESLSFALAGGKAGTLIANSHVLSRYAAAAQNVIVTITKVGTTGSAGRTRATVLYSVPSVVTAATKV